MQRLKKSGRRLPAVIATVAIVALTASLTACATSNTGQGAGGGATSAPLQSGEGSASDSGNRGSSSDGSAQRNATSDSARSGGDANNPGNAGNSDTAQQTTQDTASYIGPDRAKELATAHAGTTVHRVTFTETKQDFDDGRAEYDIEFVFNNTEYEYEIDAISGSIFSYDTEPAGR